MAEKTLGILMLDTRFPRPVGDIGNPASFPFPVLYKTVERASARQAVRGDADALLAPFIEGGLALVAEGASLIGTSCGFLALFQDRLSEALPVPVVTSSLLSYDAISRSLPTGELVGVLTIDAGALSPRHLSAAGVPLDAPVRGLKADSALVKAVFDDLNALECEVITQEMVEIGLQLAAETPALGALLLECTNMGPYADALRAALGLPVYGIVDILTEAMA